MITIVKAMLRLSKLDRILNHETMATKLNADIYFAKPYHSWKRNFPKKISFDNIENNNLQRVARKVRSLALRSGRV